jgi:hypothetical protein
VRNKLYSGQYPESLGEVAIMNIYYSTRIVCLLVAFIGTFVLPHLAPAFTMTGGMDSGKTVFVTTATRPFYGETTSMNIGTRLGASYSLSDLDGDWYTNSLHSPNAMWNRCNMTITNGAASHNCIDSNGYTHNTIDTVSIDEYGVITRAGSTNWHCHLDSGKTVAACTQTSDGDGASMELIVKKGVAYSNADLTGFWYTNEIASPGPYWMKGMVEIKSDKTWVLNSVQSDGDVDTVTGTWSLDADTATIYITPDGGEAFPCKIDSGKTVTACAKTNSGGNETTLIVMTKKAASYSSADLAGVWYAHELATGDEAPFWSRGIIITEADGGFYSSGIDNGDYLSNASGLATVSLADGLTVDAIDPTCGRKPVKRSSNYYDTIQAGYESVTSNGRIVQTRGTAIQEEITFARPYTVTLQGGYTCNFSSYPGFTFVVGQITFGGAAAAVTVDRVIVK